MIDLTYDEIVDKIKEEKGLSDEEIESKVHAKLEKTSFPLSRRQKV